MRVLKIVIGVSVGALALAGLAWAALPALAQTAEQVVNTAGLSLGRGRGHGPDGGLGHAGGADWISAAAEVTGLTTDEVRTALQGGQSLAQIAQGEGKTAAEVIAAARQALDEKLKAAVTAGTLTQAQADAKLAQFDQTAEQTVNATGFGPRGGGHHFGPAPITPTTPANPGGAAAPQPFLSAPSLDS